MMDLGARVSVPHLGPDVYGTVRFIGEVHYAKGDWAGVELDAPFGKNNGSVKGRSYFKCEDKCGVFTRLGDLKAADSHGRGGSDVDDGFEFPALNGFSADEVKRLGNERFTVGEFGAAATLYARALEICTPDAAAVLHGNRAACWLELGQFEDALDDAQKAIDLRPDWWKAHARAGRALLALSEAAAKIDPVSEDDDCDKYLEAAMESLQSAAELTIDMDARNELVRQKKRCQQLLAKRNNARKTSNCSAGASAGAGAGAGAGASAGASTGAFSGQIPEWLLELPEDICQQAMMDPMLMQMLQAEMNKMMPMDSPPPDFVTGNIDFMGGGGPMEAMKTMGGMPAEMEKHRLKKPVLQIMELHEAIKDRDMDAFRTALETERNTVGFDINELDSHGRSPLAWACAKGNLEMVELLLQAGAAVNPIKKANKRGKEEEEDEEEDDVIPLFFAVKSGNIKIVETLLNAKCELLCKEPILGHSVLHQAVKQGDAAMIEFLMQSRDGVEQLRCGEDLRGISPLALAVKVKLPSEEKRMALIELMLQAGAPVDAGVAFAAFTAARGSASCSGSGVLSMLEAREAGAPPLAARSPPLMTQSSGESILFLASRMGDAEQAIATLKALASAMGKDATKAELNRANSLGLTCLGVAARKGSPKILKALLDLGADVNAPQGDMDCSALHVVGNESNEVAWNLLLQHGADETKLNADGKQPKLRPNLGDKCCIM